MLARVASAELMQPTRRGGAVAQSQNTTVELTTRATSFRGLSTYGNVMIGDTAFEFYNERNPEDFIQIPWNEIDYIAASVMLGNHIPRFAIFTKGGASFSFSTKDNKRTLRAVREHVPADRIQRSPTFLDVVKLGAKTLFKH